MATLADLRQRVKNNLYSTAPHEHPFVTLLNDGDGINTTDTAITLDTNEGANFSQGDIIEIGTELMYVVSVSGDTLTVTRGYAGSTAASASDNAPITKNPRFWGDQIDQALVSVANGFEDWGIHGFGTGSITLVANQTYYDLTDTDIAEQRGVLAVYYAGATTLLPTHLPFRYFNNLDSNVSTTGHGIHLWEWGDKKATETVYYTYAQELTTTSALSAHQEEILVVGATALVLGASIGPATHDPGARTDRTVNPGQTSRDVRFWQGQYFIMARAEASHVQTERQRFTLGGVRQRRAQRWKN